MTKRKNLRPALTLAFLLLAILGGSMTLSGCSWFGKPDTCAKTGEDSFNELLSNQWRSYCNELDSYLHEVNAYPVTDVAKFFSEHPDRQAEIQLGLKRHKDYQACFDEKKEELELRKLQKCVDDSPALNDEILRAWDARVDEPLDYLDQDLGALEAQVQNLTVGPKSRLNEKTDRVWKKGSRSRLDKDAIESYESSVKEIEEKEKKLTNKYKEFDKAFKTAAANPILSEHIDQSQRGKLHKIGQRLKSLNQEVLELKKSLGDFRYTFFAANRHCPKAKPGSLRKVQKELFQILASKTENLKPADKNMRITGPVAKSVENNQKIERADGVVCAQRPENKEELYNRPQCTAYEFTLSRAQDDDGKWSDWSLERFEDPKIAGAIDCRSL